MIALGCDHGGYELKQEVIEYLKKKGLEYKDFGCFGTEAVDYPDYAKPVAHAVADGECDRGIPDLRDRHRDLHNGQQDQGESGRPSAPTASARRPQGSTTTPISWPWAPGSSVPVSP